MKIVVDMNLSPQWCGPLSVQGHEAVHWSTVGDPRAPDREVLEWARLHGFVVFTHDLDFSAILASGGSSGPSVIQFRARELTPQSLLPAVVAALDRFREQIERGVLLVIEPGRERARLPLRR